MFTHKHLWSLKNSFEQMTNLQLYNFKYLKLLNELRISNLQRYFSLPPPSPLPPPPQSAREFLWKQWHLSFELYILHTYLYNFFHLLRIPSCSDKYVTLQCWCIKRWYCNYLTTTTRIRRYLKQWHENRLLVSGPTFDFISCRLQLMW